MLFAWYGHAQHANSICQQKTQTKNYPQCQPSDVIIIIIIIIIILGGFWIVMRIPLRSQQLISLSMQLSHHLFVATLTLLGWFECGRGWRLLRLELIGVYGYACEMI